ncbi:MAG TPA: hypothetical protein VF805_10855 [Anaeromyxobacteraceae bacterium]
MSTAIRRPFFENDRAVASHDASELSWGWPGLVMLIVVAVLTLGIARAAAHPADVSAGTPEPPYIGWSD